VVQKWVRPKKRRHSLRPRRVAFFKDDHVIEVACGSAEAQTLALTRTTDGKTALWSWGDISHGKLGRTVEANRSGIPGRVEISDEIQISKVFCGAQFCVALSSEQKLYTWGKGEYFRLGHGNEANVTKPKLLELPNNENAVEVAVGSLHVLVTTKNNIYTWGDNDEGQNGNGTVNSVTRPEPLSSPELLSDTARSIFISAGSAHSVAWSVENNDQTEKWRIPDSVWNLGAQFL